MGAVSGDPGGGEIPMRPVIRAIGTSNHRIRAEAFIRQREYLKLQLKMRIQKKVLNLSKMLASNGLFFPFRL
jgi:hypothetical protein